MTGETAGIGLAVLRTAYLEGCSIAALAREHGVSRGAIRTAVADLMPERTAAGHEGAPTPELPVTLDMPGKVADFLHAVEPEAAERAALDHGVTVRHGQGYALCVSPAPAVHRRLLAHCRPLDGIQGTPEVPVWERPVASTRTGSAPSPPPPDMIVLADSRRTDVPRSRT